MTITSQVKLVDYMKNGESPGDALRRAMQEAGYRNWGVYANPIEIEGIFPASMDEALGAYDDDPTLVYVTDVE